MRNGKKKDRQTELKKAKQGKEMVWMNEWCVYACGMKDEEKQKKNEMCVISIKACHSTDHTSFNCEHFKRSV